ncbi:SAM-dependent methyltransferase [Streptomyces sp. NPDC058001]|uniref:SAM-dependent methyltransferase n=1 Tax=Streptomyces sp. NPDC058001 TaxID=3346300 RepID=UPI0036E7F89A
MTDGYDAAARIDTSKMHPARVYDYLLGGKTNYVVDEEFAEGMIAVDATVRNTAMSNRWFMHRATRWLAGRGVGQYIDIGTGIPTEPNLHRIAQQADPTSRVVYVDNDPIVLRHAEALLDSTEEGSTDYVEADVRDPAQIVAKAGATLDLQQPVALSLIALLHFVADEDDAYGIVSRLVDALPAGSYLVIAHVTGDFSPEESAEVVARYRRAGSTLRPRTQKEVAQFFEGMDLVEPGLTLAPEWHPGLGPDQPPAGDISVPVYVGVARKR